MTGSIHLCLIRNKRTQILKRLFALKMGWIEPDNENEEDDLINEDPGDDAEDPGDDDGNGEPCVVTWLQPI